MYDQNYRGLPAEIRMMIWKICLKNRFPPQIIAKGPSSSEIMQHGTLQATASHQPLQQSTQKKVEKHKRLRLAVLQLDRTTRSEALNSLPKYTTLDLSNLRESRDLSHFLDRMPTWLSAITKHLVIERSLIIKRFIGRTACGSQAESQRLYSLIRQMLPLCCLTIVIDACRWQDVMMTRGRNQKPEPYVRHLELLWDTDDTAKSAAWVEKGDIRIVELCISLPSSIASRYFYDQFVDKLECGEQVQVEKFVSRVVGDAVTKTHLKHSSMLKNFWGARIITVALTNINKKIISSVSGRRPPMEAKPSFHALMNSSLL